MLRAAVRVDGADVPAWAAATVAKMAGYVEVVAVLGVEPRPRPALVEAYLKLDRRVLQFGLDPFAQDRLPGHDPRLCAEADAISEIAEADVDLVLDFTGNPASALPGLGKLGTWYVRLGSPDLRAVTARHGWEQWVFDLEVVARRRDGEEVVLERSISAVSPVSIARTVDPALWKATAMLARSVRNAAAGQVHWVQQRSPAEGSRGSVRSVVEQGVATVARVARGRLAKAIWEHEWVLAARRTDGRGRQMFHPLPQAANGYRADPFVFKRDGRVYLFFEEFDYDRGLGHISVGVLYGDGDLVAITPCLVPDFHVSYPGVFEHDGTIYMVPETVANQKITLYRAVDFPTSWEPVGDLVTDVRAVDPTLHYDGERWWLFAAVYERGAAAGDELFLWSSDSLTGEWVPHPANPVVSDVRCSRPAGMLFRRGADLIRPAQNGSRGYGSGIVLRRVTRLTTDEYAEETVGVIDATWLPRARGTHTLNRNHVFEVTDGETRRVRFRRQSMLPS